MLQFAAHELVHRIRWEAWLRAHHAERQQRRHVLFLMLSNHRFQSKTHHFKYKVHHFKCKIDDV